MISAKLKLSVVTLVFVVGGLALFLSTTSGQTGGLESRTASLIRNNNVGVAYMEQLKFDEAAAEFVKNTSLDESFVPGHVNLGIAHFYRQDYEGALASFAKAIQLDRDQIQARFMSGLIYRNQDQPEDAIREFSEVFRQDSDDPTTNYFLGLLLSRQKEYEAAIEKLKRSIARQPYNASARYNLAIALLRSGNREQGQIEMEAFKKLQGQFGTDTIGLQYREQGTYSFVIDNLSEYLPGAPMVEKRNPVSFKSIASDAGLTFSHGGPGEISVQVASGSDLQGTVVPYVGSGLSFGDYDNDGWLDLFIANASPKGAQGALFRNRGDGTFENRTGSSGIDFSGQIMAPLWGDIDNDEDLDLYLVNFGKNILYRNDGEGRFTDITDSAGAGDPSWGVTGAFVDVDHDGDLDILVGNFINAPSSQNYPTQFPDGFSGTENVLYQNTGDGTFTDITEAAKLTQQATTLGLVATDFNNSRDIDLVISNLGTPNSLLSNMRDGSFKDVAAESKSGLVQTAGLAVADFNKDGLMDLVVGGRFAKDTKLLFYQRNGEYREESLGDIMGLSSPDTVHNAEALDHDNDGDLDLLLMGSSLLDGRDSSPNLVLLENRQGKFVNVTRESGLDKVSGQPVRGLSIADFDNDGDLDFAVNVNGGSPLLLRNDGGNRNNWIQIQLIGSSSNKSGIGTKVEVLTGRHWQKMEVAAGSGFLSQSSSITHFGLGQYDNLDVLRMLWPGGVLQSEIDSPINSRLLITELDRKGTSCPIMYVWNGENYSFHTDFLGGSAFGSLVAPGQFNYPDTDEYIRLNRDQLRLKDGRVAITLNNQLEEVIFFDQVELLAVDHPDDYEVYPDEKLLPGPPYEDFQLLTLENAKLPVSAVDGRGTDVLSELAEIDRVYPHSFRELPFKGYANIHELILDLGEVDPSRTILVMQAWIDYADSSSNLAASQAGVQLIPPYLQVQDENGEWVTAIERMGFPAGLPKPMTVDLSGKFLSSSRSVKIVTNMRIYWDQILVESGPARADYRLQRLQPSVADLHFKGFPAWVSPDGKLPKIYDYDTIVTAPQWKVHIGAYTRFGDVLPLLDKTDDKYVITQSGDEIEVEFDLQGLPELPNGWVRDYLVFVDGFGKDMDINSSRPDYVGPLPFHGMTEYPYGEGESYPQTDEYLEFQRSWNTRIVDDWYPGLKQNPRLKVDVSTPVDEARVDDDSPE